MRLVRFLSRIFRGRVGPESGKIQKSILHEPYWQIRDKKT
jgi:hypothetical protein